MKVSIITICLNCQTTIAKTIESVLNQKYHDIEYIIIDGGSTDGTLEEIEKFSKRIDIFVSEPDSGIYSAINKGFSMANGDILGLLHAGDLLYDKDVVYNIEKNFRETESKLLYGHSEVYSANRAKIVRKNISPPYNKKLMSFGWFPSHQSVYIKKEIISMFGNYNEDFKIAGDYEFLLRVLIVHNVQAHMLDMFIVKFYLGGTSSKNFSSVIKANYECINAWNINNLRIPLYTIPLKLLRKKMQIIQQLISKI